MFFRRSAANRSQRFRIWVGLDAFQSLIRRGNRGCYASLLGGFDWWFPLATRFFTADGSRRFPSIFALDREVLLLRRGNGGFDNTSLGRFRSRFSFAPGRFHNIVIASEKRSTSSQHLFRPHGKFGPGVLGPRAWVLVIAPPCRMVLVPFKRHGI
jgi:hypothetical protein